MLQNEKGKIIMVVNDGYETNMVLLTEEQKRLVDYLKDNGFGIDDITILDENCDLQEI
jgi:hypothetical protein